MEHLQNFRLHYSVVCPIWSILAHPSGPWQHMDLSWPPDLLASPSSAWLVQTDWGQSVFKVGRCIVTPWLWVGIQPITSSHTLYLTHMHGPSHLPLVTLHLGSPND